MSVRQGPKDETNSRPPRGGAGGSRPSGKHDARTAADGHTHEPVQHRDGKPPWCPACGLTADGRIPERPRAEVDPGLVGGGRSSLADRDVR